MPFWLLAWVLLGPAPASFGQDGDRPRRYIPRVQAGRSQQQDEDYAKPAADNKPVLELLEDLGDSIKTDFPKNDIPGDLELFIRKLDRELKAGVDRPRYDILQNALAAQKTAAEGYRALVQDALTPINGRAKPLVDQIFTRLQPMVLKMEQLTQTLVAVLAQIQQGQGDPQQLAGLGAQASQQLQQLEPLRQLDQQAFMQVQAAQGGIQQAAQAASNLGGSGPGSVSQASSLDSASLRGATRNSASGRETPKQLYLGGSSGAVLEMVDKRLEAAGKRMFQGFTAVQKLTEPQGGDIAGVLDKVKEGAEMVQRSVADGQRQDPNAGSRAREAKAKAADLKMKEMQVEMDWNMLQDTVLGRADENEIKTRLPAPLSLTSAYAAAPRDTAASLRGPSKRIEVKKDEQGRPIRYPDSLSQGADSVSNSEFGSSGALSQCRNGGC